MNANESKSVSNSVIDNQIHGYQELLCLLKEYEQLGSTMYENVTTGDINGNVRCGDVIFSFCLIPSQHKHFIVVANLNSKEMGVLHGFEDNKGEVEYLEKEFPSFKPDGIVDCDDNGRRWEGGVIDGTHPHGYGTYFDENGNVESECFVFDGKKVCYVRDYYPDTKTLSYEGAYGVDYRCGYGKTFDRNGDKDYEGLWYHGKPIGDLKNSNPPAFPFLHSYLSELSLTKANLNSSSCNQFILLACLANLTCIQIGDNCLSYVHRFELDGLPKLSNLVIGNACIRNSKSAVRFIVSRCMSLQSIEIGNNCCTRTHQVIIKGISC